MKTKRFTLENLDKTIWELLEEPAPIESPTMGSIPVASLNLNRIRQAILKRNSSSLPLVPPSSRER